MGAGKNYHSAQFKRLGYLSLDNNERSSYTARELKTVFVDHVGKYVKLLINEHHVNKHNIYNQVGVIAMSVMGTEMQGPADSELKAGGRGQSQYPSSKAVSTNPYNDLATDMTLDPHTANKLRQLADAKSRAIDNEDYLTAKQIKVAVTYTTIYTVYNIYPIYTIYTVYTI